MALFEMVWGQLDEHVNSMDDYQTGKLGGRIVGEAIGLVGVPGGAGVKVTQMLGELRTLDKFNDLRQRLTAAGQFDQVLGPTGKVSRLAEDLTTTRMCFVAGTMVVTARGLVAIECVEVGDRVWSRDEHSGEEGFRAVIDTIRTSPRQLVEIRAVSAAGSAFTLTGTAEHPFYVAARPSALDAAGFVPMGELLVGDALVLSGGAGRAHVTDVRVVRGPPTDNERLHGWDGRAYRTFNIEVEEWHTYFVAGDQGGGAVWVHNEGDECARILAAFRHFMRRDNLNNPVEGYRRVRQRLPNMSEKAEAGFVQGVIDDIDAMHASGQLDARWQQLGFDQATQQFKAREVFGGHRFEAATGRTVRRPNGTSESGDWVDDLGRQWDQEGPLPEQGDFEGFLANLRTHIAIHRQGDEKLLVDVAGMTILQQNRVRQLLEAQYPQHHFILTGSE